MSLFLSYLLKHVHEWFDIFYTTLDQFLVAFFPLPLHKIDVAFAMNINNDEQMWFLIVTAE